MKIIINSGPEELGMASGKAAAEAIRSAIAKNGEARLVLATGTSQFETLRVLVGEKLDWSRVTLFHLDEYTGLSESAPASFRRYIKERFIEKVGPLKETHLIRGEADPNLECARLESLIREAPIDLALVGIGENGHLGFNDPPADFSTDRAFLVVALDQACRSQQVGEGWFKDISEVPLRAITMSISQIMKSRKIICSVPHLRKAVAVRDCLEGPVSNLHPASILQQHPDCLCYLDRESGSLLEKIYHE